MIVQSISPADEAAFLALNNAHAEELSWLEPERLHELIERAFFARRVGSIDAFILAFDQGADYDSPNFLWFRERYPRFVYVDRIAVAPHASGRGLARQIYEELFAFALNAGHELVTCEVNADPPNPASHTFHATLGFEPVGEEAIHGGAKTVRYYLRDLRAAN